MMTKEEIDAYEQAVRTGSLPPEENPLDLFSTTSTNLLAKALAREFNILDLIRMEMRKRGVNDKGQWIGFEASAKANTTSRRAPKSNTG